MNAVETTESTPGVDNRDMKPNPVIENIAAQARSVAAVEHFKRTGELPDWARRAA